MLYPCVFCVALLMDMFVLCVSVCGYYFVVEYYGGVECEWSWSVG